MHVHLAPVVSELLQVTSQADLAARRWQRLTADACERIDRIALAPRRPAVAFADRHRLGHLEHSNRAAFGAVAAGRP